jgi:hypothetical protein
LLIVAALPHKGMMTSWWGQRNVDSRRRRSWLPACSITALAVCLTFQATHADDVVTIQLVGEIDPECRLSALPSSIELAQISASGTQSIPFEIDCNTPFEYSVRSREGALKSGVPAPSIGFVDQILYVLQTRIPTDEFLILNQCDSQSLSGASPSCGHGNSGNATAIHQTASLAISWTVSAEVVAGTYTDVLTLTFGPRL